jgi:fatty-acyl-CoA synthase
VLVQIGRSTANALWYRDLFLGVSTELDPVDFAVAHATGASPMSAIPASPVMHGAGFMYTSLPTLVTGGTVTTLQERPFDAHELLRTIETTRTQVTAIVGDAFALPIVRALDTGDPDGNRYDTSPLRLICSAGVAWSEHIKERLLEHIPQVTLFDACGTTEGVGYGTRQVRLGDRLSTANFDAAPGLKVFSPEGFEVPPGEIGLLAGPAHGTGYFRDPEKSAATFLVIDGVQYAMPGDLGRIETDGTVTLIGRGVTTINTGGEKVYPTEVEDVVKALPGVDDCLVLGIPDERFGQRVAALVVLAPGQTYEPTEVAAASRASLAGYKAPRHIRFVDQIPRTPNGKIDYPAATELASTD